jgi:hypothetical protein
LVWSSSSILDGKSNSQIKFREILSESVKKSLHSRSCLWRFDNHMIDAFFLIFKNILLSIQFHRSWLQPSSFYGLLHKWTWHLVISGIRHTNTWLPWGS